MTRKILPAAREAGITMECYRSSPKVVAQPLKIAAGTF